MPAASQLPSLQTSCRCIVEIRRRRENTHTSEVASLDHPSTGRDRTLLDYRSNAGHDEQPIGSSKPECPQARSSRQFPCRSPLGVRCSTQADTAAWILLLCFLHSAAGAGLKSPAAAHQALTATLRQA